MLRRGLVRLGGKAKKAPKKTRTLVLPSPPPPPGWCHPHPCHYEHNDYHIKLVQHLVKKLVLHPDELVDWLKLSGKDLSQKARYAMAVGTLGIIGVAGIPEASKRAYLQSLDYYILRDVSREHQNEYKADKLKREQEARAKEDKPLKETASGFVGPVSKPEYLTSKGQAPHPYSYVPPREPHRPQDLKTEDGQIVFPPRARRPRMMVWNASRHKRFLFNDGQLQLMGRRNEEIHGRKKKLDPKEAPKVKLPDSEYHARRIRAASHCLPPHQVDGAILNAIHGKLANETVLNEAIVAHARNESWKRLNRLVGEITGKGARPGASKNYTTKTAWSDHKLRTRPFTSRDGLVVSRPHVGSYMRRVEEPHQLKMGLDRDETVPTAKSHDGMRWVKVFGLYPYQTMLLARMYALGGRGMQATKWDKRRRKRGLLMDFQLYRAYMDALVAREPDSGEDQKFLFKNEKSRAAQIASIEKRFRQSKFAPYSYYV